MATDELDEQVELDTTEEDGAVTVEEETEPGFADLDAASPNLVPYFEGKGEEGVKFLSELSKQVCDHFDEGWSSTEEWRMRRTNDYNLLVGKVEERNPEVFGPGCANVHDPLMLIRHIRLTTNLYSELFAEREFIYRVTPNGPDDADADALTIHGHWQLKNEQTDFYRQQMRGIGEFVGPGDVFAWSSRDSARDRNRHEILSADDVVIPYVHTSTEVDMSDVPWKVRVLRKFRYELQALKRDPKWSNIEKIIAKEAPAWDEQERPQAEAVAAATGHKPGDKDANKGAPYVLYEYHGWAEIPGQDRDRAICVVVDKETKNIARLYIREEPDWRDEARYASQMQQFQQFQADMQKFADSQVLGQTIQQFMPMEMDPVMQQRMAAELQALPQEPPPVPPWMDEAKIQAFLAGDFETAGPDQVKMVPIEYGSHGVCIENPVGALGLGFGRIIADLNILSDEALNRFYDAAALNNVSMFFALESAGLPKGQIPIGPGKVHHLKSTVDDIQKAVKEFRPGGANPQMQDMSRMANDMADGLTVSGIVSGEPGKSGETFRGVATRMERATKQLSVPTQNYAMFLANIFRNNAKLNYMFMPEEQIVDYAGKTGVRVTRDMYRRDYKVDFEADFKFGSQAQRVAEADEIVAMVTTLPPLQANSYFVYHAIKRSLLARGRKDMADKLGPEPQPPPTPFPYTPPPMPGQVGPDGQPVPGLAGPPGPGGPPPEMGPVPEEGGGDQGMQEAMA